MSKDIVGERIGIWDVLYECDEKANDGHRLYRVKCIECGWETNMIKSGMYRAKKCNHVGFGGVYIADKYDFVWHYKRLQTIFNGMKRRCYSNNSKDFRWYGAKGIKVCAEWLNNPQSFESWALANGYNDTLTIDRKDENKDYCPENCRWVTLENNSKYKSTTSLITVNCETHTGKDWARKLGLSVNTINKYVKTYGLDNTIKFIEMYLKNPGLKPKSNQSYYNLYMTTQN